MATAQSPNSARNILAVDIGGGTQDILLWTPEMPVENAHKLVVPSPTVLVGREIADATWNRQAICLVGQTMGGGASSRAVQRHLNAGLKVYALPAAALTIHDELERVRDLGVEIVEEPPATARRIRLQDLDMQRLREAFAVFSLELPDTVAVAVQDHGFAPGQSNRIARFQYWQKLLDRGGDLRSWALLEPPSSMTRMLAVKESAPAALVLDTGLAAILGALLDPFARSRRRQGLTVVNIGNFHTVAALVHEGRVYGIYEHHTGLLDSLSLGRDLQAFAGARLSHQEVFDANGHGCAYADSIPACGFEQLLVTGPQRRRFQLPDSTAAAPFGDMMLTGCFGLARAACWQNRWSVTEFE